MPFPFARSRATASAFLRRKTLSRPLTVLIAVYAAFVLVIAILGVLYCYTYNLQP